MEPLRSRFPAKDPAEKSSDMRNDPRQKTGIHQKHCADMKEKRGKEDAEKTADSGFQHFQKISHDSPLHSGERPFSIRILFFPPCLVNIYRTAKPFLQHQQDRRSRPASRRATEKPQAGRKYGRFLRSGPNSVLSV